MVIGQMPFPTKKSIWLEEEQHQPWQLQAPTATIRCTPFYCKLDTNGVIRTYKQAENSPKLSISEDEAVMASSSGSVLPGQVRAHLCL